MSFGHPPDPGIAAGPDNLVLSTNDTVAILSKTGASIASVTLNNLYSSVKPFAETLTDPRVVFDAGSSRFFLVAAGGIRVPVCAVGSCVSHFMLAVSKSASPRTLTPTDWYFYALDATLDGTTPTTDFADFTKIGVGDNFVVLTANMGGVTSTGYVKIRVLDKAKVISGQAVTWADFSNLKEPGSDRTVYQLQPVVNAAHSGTVFLVSASTTVTCGLTVWAIENPLTAPTIAIRVASPGSGIFPCRGEGQDAAQPGGAPSIPIWIRVTISPGIYRNNSIWVAQYFAKDFGSGLVSAVRWAQVDVSGWPNSVSTVQDSFFGADKVSQFFPEVMVDEANNATIVFYRSSASEYPSIYYAGRLGTDSPNTLRSIRLLKASNTSLTFIDPNHGFVRWGDYTGIALDPIDGSVWMLGEYAKTASTWGTWIGQLTPMSGTSAPVITTQPANLTVTAGSTGSFTVVATGVTTYQWQVSTNGGSSWTDLTNAAPYGDVTTATLTVTSASASLNGGQYRVIATNSAGTATSSAATLTVYGAASLNRSVLRFAATKAGATGALTAVTGAQTVTVTFAGAASAWTATTNQTWLQVTGGSGSAAGTFTVAVVNPSNAIGGSTALSATVTLTAATAPNSPVTIPVTLSVNQSNTGTVPFGTVDTPTDRATVRGAIPMAGWALDDIGVNRVELWRNCLETIDRPPGACASPAAGLAANYVLLGKAFLLAGARPDVEAANPTLPFAYRAGWGFMLLTNALPHQTKGTTEGGQGSYVLSAFAIDEDAHAALLGTKTITADNDHATTPFGAIDTPAQGGTIPEASAPFNNLNAYPNFGWAMTQAGKCLDTTSPTAYKVFIDGVSRTLTAGTNWFAGLNRSDLAAAYPGLCNSTNALAVYYINAGALGLTSGLHTISWDVTDSAGQTVAGLGTRFFTVVATSGDVDVTNDASIVRLTLDTTGATHVTGATDAMASSGSIRPPDSTNSTVVSGFRLRSELGRTAVALAEAVSRTVAARIGGPDAPAESIAPDAVGHRYVQLPIGRRLWLDLGGPVDAGFQQLGDTQRALPIGSTLDRASGSFAWEPPAGFFGPFELIFTTATDPIAMTVTIVGGSGVPAPIAMQIDAPLDGAVVSGPLTITGWAFDPQAVTGSGIDAIHVWALRRATAAASPQFLGAATLGLARPDVAQAFGAPFRAAGFQLSAASLAPGAYDVTVHVRSARTGQWENAQTVHVMAR